MTPSLATLKQDAVPLLKQTWTQFSKHNGQWLAAALAYFTAFAIAPLIIVVVAVVGLFFGTHEGALKTVYTYMEHDAGKSAAQAIKAIVGATMNQQHKGTIAQIIAWILFIVAAVGLFNSVQFALNTVWDVEPKQMSIKEQIRQRGMAFLVMLGIALLLLASMGVNALLTIAGNALTHVFPGFATLMKIVDFVFSFGVITVAFAILFEFLPECRIEWRDVWVGAAVTSLLFTIGQFLLGWYLGRAGLTSGFGAFGSLVVFLLWTNYSSQILLLGAEFTNVYAHRHGSKANAGAVTTRGEVSLSADRPLRRPL